MKQLSCLKTMTSHKQWMPDQEADPGTEVKSGDLYLLTSAPTSQTSRTNRAHRASRYPVHVKVYRSCFGHYAVVTASLRAPATYLNLRTCNARTCLSTSSESSSDSGKVTASRFRVEMGGGEGQVIYFEVGGRGENSSDVEEWARAFQGVAVTHCPGTISPSLSPVIPRSPIMPTLQESLEEEEEEEEEGVVGGLG